MSATTCVLKRAGNFRDLNAAVYRMATLAGGKRITTHIVKEEIERLMSGWGQPGSSIATGQLALEILEEDQWERLDLFERGQLDFVIGICRESHSLSDAGRMLFNVSREKRKDNNDADRLRKYLLRYGLAWADCKQQQPAPVPLLGDPARRQCPICSDAAIDNRLPPELPRAWTSCPPRSCCF